METERPGVFDGEGLTLNLLELQNERTVVIANPDVPRASIRSYGCESRAEVELVMEDLDDAMMEITEPIFVPSRKVDIPVCVSQRQPTPRNTGSRNTGSDPGCCIRGLTPCCVTPCCAAYDGSSGKWGPR